MRWTAATIIAVLVVLPSAASAVDLPVSFTIDEKAFKANTVATTPLTFEVYTAPNCASPVFTEVIDAGDPSLLVEQVRLRKVKQGPKPPKILRLRVLLMEVPAESVYFVKVTGTGITPVDPIDGDCQPQFPTLSGPRQDLKDRPAPRDQKAQRVRKDHRDHKGLRVIPALQVRKAHKEPLVHRDPKAPTVRRVRKDLQDRKAPKVSPGSYSAYSMATGR